MSEVPNIDSQEPIYKQLSATNERIKEKNSRNLLNELIAIEMESLCINCEKNGKTVILLTDIPFFKEVIIMSFYCEHCGYKNSEIQPGSKIQEKGVKITFKLIDPRDLSRDVVKSEYATLKIPELDLEVPSSKKGYLNTIEGFLNNFYDELSEDQKERKKIDVEFAEKLDQFLVKLKQYSLGELLPFTFVIDDPSGNSFLKNPFAPKEDPNLIIEYYTRNPEQLKMMGYDVENSILDNEVLKEKAAESEGNLNHNDNVKPTIVQIDAHRVDFSKPITEEVKGESLSFETLCHVCHEMSSTKMCTTTIPYFKELIIMSFTCDKCGARSTEVKTGGETSTKGTYIKLSVEKMDDLKRDCFKSETCKLTIPEIELELTYGTLGGRYTTIEGLIEDIHTNFKKHNPFAGGDSVDPAFRSKISEFLYDLKDLLKLRKKFHIILEDPMSNSFVQNPYYPEKDPRVVSHLYERTNEENEILGLNDIKTENY